MPKSLTPWLTRLPTNTWPAIFKAKKASAWRKALGERRRGKDAGGKALGEGKGKGEGERAKGKRRAL